MRVTFRAHVACVRASVGRPIASLVVAMLCAAVSPMGTAQGLEVSRHSTQSQAAAGGQAAGGVPTSAPAPPAKASALVSKSSIKTTDRVTLTIQVDAPPGWRLDPVDPNPALPEGWNILSRPSPVADFSAGRERHTIAFELEPFLPGNVKIGPISVTLRPAPDGSGPPGASGPAPDSVPITLTTEPISMEIASVLAADDDGAELAAIRGVVTPPKPWDWRLLTGVGLGIALVVAGAVWLVARARRVPIVPTVTRPAHELALEQLDLLLRRDLLAPGRERYKLFFDEASAILRRYIEDRFQLRAPERTTEEFLSDAKRSSVLTEDDVSILGRFLTRCDLVKFAKETPDAGEGERAIGVIREFINKTRADEITVVVSGPGVAHGPVAGQREAA